MALVRRMKMTVSYDGTEFSGWQIQPNGPSIQQHLSDAIFHTTGERFHPVGSGRTDSGVHALGQIAHFDTAHPMSSEKWLGAFRHYLPSAIVVRAVEEVAPSFDAQRHAVAKHYRYVLHDGAAPDPFMRLYAWKVPPSLDSGLMHEAARALLGTHDFRSFETNWPNRKSSVRTVFRCDVSRVGEFVHLDVEANGFLYNMVRTIVGTLFEIGRSKWPVEQMKAILEGQSRSLAGPTAPPHGLFLVRVTYPDPGAGFDSESPEDDLA